jgi:hypothetical protein
MPVIPHPPYSSTWVPAAFLCFAQLKEELNGRYFDTIEVIEAESPSQNTTTIMQLKIAEVLGTVHMVGRELL